MAPGPIVVTGADGFVGSALVAHFAATGRPFVAAVRRHPADAAAKSHHRAVGDLAAPSSKPRSMRSSPVRRPSCISWAGRTCLPTPRPIRAPSTIPPTSSRRERLAAAAVRAGVPRFVLASTIKVHGEATAPGRPFRADDPLLPHDAYARSKVEAERGLAAVAAGTWLDAIVLRLPLVYGPRVKGNFLTSSMPLRAARCCRSAGSRTGAISSTSAISCTRSRRSSTRRIPIAGAWLAADGEAIATARARAACGGARRRAARGEGPAVAAAAGRSGDGTGGALAAHGVLARSRRVTPSAALRPASVHARPGSRRDRRLVAPAARDLIRAL